MSPQPTSVPQQAQPNGRNNGGRVAALLLKYLTERPGTQLFRTDIAAETGLSEEQVRVGMSNLRVGDKLGAKDALETVVAGQVWRWHPNKAKAESPEDTTVPASKRVFGEVGKTREGDLILQADDGSLWRAQEL